MNAREEVRAMQYRIWIMFLGLAAAGFFLAENPTVIQQMALSHHTKDVIVQRTSAGQQQSPKPADSKDSTAKPSDAGPQPAVLWERIRDHNAGHQQQND